MCPVNIKFVMNSVLRGFILTVKRPRGLTLLKLRFVSGHRFSDVTPTVLNSPFRGKFE